MVQRMSADQPMVGGGHTISVPHGSIPATIALVSSGYPSFRAGSLGQSRRADAPGTPGASMRSVRSAVVTGLAVVLSLSLPLAAADAASGRRRPVRQVGSKRPALAPRPQPTMTRAQANQFLRSRAGKQTIRQYTAEALEAPRPVSDFRAEKGFSSLREQRDFYKSRGRILKIFSYASSVVT